VSASPPEQRPPRQGEAEEWALQRHKGSGVPSQGCAVRNATPGVPDPGFRSLVGTPVMITRAPSRHDRCWPASYTRGPAHRLQTLGGRLHETRWGADAEARRLVSPRRTPRGLAPWGVLLCSAGRHHLVPAAELAWGGCESLAPGTHDGAVALHPVVAVNAARALVPRVATGSSNIGGCISSTSSVSRPENAQSDEALKAPGMTDT
jgi:hypothetical protein